MDPKIKMETWLHPDAIDRGAKALRDHQMAGRFTVDWENVPQGQKKKWLRASQAVLEAAHSNG